MTKRQLKKIRRTHCPRCRRKDRPVFWEITNWTKFLCLMVQCKCGYVSKDFKGVLK